MSRLDEINAKRIANAMRLKEWLSGEEGVQFITAPTGAHAIYVRLPILIRNSTTRTTIFHELRRRGLGASLSYPEAVPGIPGIQPHLACDRACPGGALVARSILTLPTHTHVRDVDLHRIVETIRECLK